MKRFYLFALSIALSLQAAMAQQADFQWNKSRQTQSVVSGRFTRSLSVPNGPTPVLPIWVADSSKRGSLYVQTAVGQPDKLKLWDSNSSTWVDVGLQTSTTVDASNNIAFFNQSGELVNASRMRYFTNANPNRSYALFPSARVSGEYLYVNNDVYFQNVPTGGLDTASVLLRGPSGRMFSASPDVFIKNGTTVQSSTDFNIGGSGTANQFRASAYFAGTPGVGNWTQVTPGTVSYYTTSANANISHTGTDLVFNNAYGKFLFNSGFVYDAPNGNLGLGTTSPKNTVGRVLHMFNNANTGTAASNTTLILESQNRNANVNYLLGPNSAGGLLFQNLAGSTNLAQISMNQTAGYPALGIITNGFTNMGFNTNGTNETNMYGQLNIGGSTKFSGSLNEIFGPVKQILTLTGTTTGVYVPGTSLVANIASVGNGVDPKGGSTLFVSANDQDGVTGMTAPIMMGLQLSMNPKYGRMLGGIDDAVGINIKNVSQNLAWLTEFFYIGSNATFKAAGIKEARAAFNVDANVDVLLGYTGSGTHGFDTYTAPGYTATFTGSAIRLGNGHRISTRKADGTQDITTSRLNSSDVLEFYNGLMTLNGTGQLGVQSIGHTTNGSSLVLNSNYGATKARIYFGAAGLNSYFSELENGLHINNIAGDATSKLTVQAGSGTTSGSVSIARLYSFTGQSLNFLTDYDGSGAVTNMAFRSTSSTPLALGTTSAQKGFYMFNNGRIVVGASNPTDTGFQFDVQGLGRFTSDLEISTSNKGVVLWAPDGTRYRVTVANGGTLQTTSI